MILATSLILSTAPIADWRPFVINNPYFNLNHWLNEMDAENSQALIYAKETPSHF